MMSVADMSECWNRCGVFLAACLFQFVAPLDLKVTDLTEFHVVPACSVTHKLVGKMVLNSRKHTGIPDKQQLALFWLEGKVVFLVDFFNNSIRRNVAAMKLLEFLLLAILQSLRRFIKAF